MKTMPDGKGPVATDDDLDQAMADHRQVEHAEAVLNLARAEAMLNHVELCSRYGVPSHWVLLLDSGEFMEPPQQQGRPGTQPPPPLIPG